jgi:chromosomal replication initiator protein
LELPANLEPSAAWSAIRAELRQALGDSTYELWIAPLELRALEPTSLRLAAPNATQSWVTTRFGRVLETCAKTVLGAAIRVVVEGAAPSRPSCQPSPRPKATGETLNPRYSFDQFVIGESNRLAHAACLAAAELPGAAYNPLFLHAPPGMGKTHLLHAIGNYVTAFGGGTVVRYTTVESFTNHFITALGSRSLDRFKSAYREVDVLLIDDVQFLASKAKTEEEFFHTFNALHENGRQVVLTCDRLPQALLGVEKRLRERFEAGLVADIAPPDFSTRLTILRKRAMVDRVPLSDPAVLELIAERIDDNIRALEGALIRVVAYHSLTGQPIDLPLAGRVLDRLYPQSVSKAGPGLADIQEAVARFYELPASDLHSSSRAARVAWPRQVAIYLTRELTPSPLKAIGEAFGGRNHATILYACKRVEERACSEPDIGSDLRLLKQRILSTEDDRPH